MSHRYPLLATLCAALLLTCAAPVHATRPVPSIKAAQSAPLRVLVGNPLQHFSSTCALGVTVPGASYQDYLYPPDDGYYTLLDPAACACSGPDGELLSTAHVQLHFMGNCAIPVRVGIVAADASDPSCLRPLPGDYVCPPIEYELTGQADGNYDFALPLAADCCVNQKAFLEITFLTAGDCAQPPWLFVSSLCNPCISWNYWGETLTELCGPLAGNPMMYVDGTCCSVVPAIRHSWGRLKMMYR
jgi:hypothetical protein